MEETRQIPEERKRKIIHIDMDCFYAAIEVRDNPSLEGKPVAVGGRSGRGVLTTCNYEARKYGCRSAMPSFKARQLCPELILLPTRFDVYKQESSRIRSILAEFTELIEPLSLDEAYLDVSQLASAASSIAWEIRDRIRTTLGLTASAGIAENKFLAKIASDWNKPNGQFEVSPDILDGFLRELPVSKIWGVGKRTADKMEEMNIRTCGDLQERSEVELMSRFGKFGHSLYLLCRGIDERRVNPNRERKSVSNERTFFTNLTTVEEGLEKLSELVDELIEDLSGRHRERKIREGFVKLKFEDFQVTTAQAATDVVESALFEELLADAWGRGGGKSVRLIGAGVRFHPIAAGSGAQLELF